MTATHTYEESKLTASDGLLLYTQSWCAAHPKATIVLIHGISEHSTRYRHVGESWAAHGYTVHTMDLRGHGRSPGKRILVRQIEEHSPAMSGHYWRGHDNKRPPDPSFCSVIAWAV